MEFSFIFEALSDLGIESKPMFGARGVYFEGKIVFILRDRPTSPRDNGMWLATTGEHHASLLLDFPEMRSIELFGPGPTGWQNIPLETEDFEESALRVCKMIRARDPRIGKIPQKSVRRKKKSPAKRSLSRTITKKLLKKTSKKPATAVPRKKAKKVSKKSPKRPSRR